MYIYRHACILNFIPRPSPVFLFVFRSVLPVVVYTFILVPIPMHMYAYTSYIRSTVEVLLIEIHAPRLFCT